MYSKISQIFSSNVGAVLLSSLQCALWIAREYWRRAWKGFIVKAFPIKYDSHADVSAATILSAKLSTVLLLSTMAYELFALLSTYMVATGFVSATPTVQPVVLSELQLAPNSLPNSKKPFMDSLCCRSTMALQFLLLIETWLWSVLAASAVFSLVSS